MGHREEDVFIKASRRRKEITVDDIALVGICQAVAHLIVKAHFWPLTSLQNDLHPLELADAQKFVAAMRQAVNQGHKDIVTRLLYRVMVGQKDYSPFTPKQPLPFHADNTNLGSGLVHDHELQWVNHLETDIGYAGSRGTGRRTDSTLG
jgi:hypothetical protein